MIAGLAVTEGDEARRRRDRQPAYRRHPKVDVALCPALPWVP